MGLVVLLVPGTPEEVALGPPALTALADLGVTSVSLVGNGEAVGVVLEGWAFDSAAAGEAAAAVGARSAVALTSLVHMAVSAAATKGGNDEEEGLPAAGGVAAGAR